jgi:hypothetical protein
MTDEVKTDAEKVLADTKATIANLESDEVSASGWIKGHTAWMIGLGSFVAGLVVMYLLKH